mmetsp:Transcript_24276/g.68905  ORF Transcript_24276/g.68905 Transcript_24276/m.68905 type:complete len:234 (+) Transcript_24276:54-755(+)
MASRRTTILWLTVAFALGLGLKKLEAQKLLTDMLPIAQSWKEESPLAAAVAAMVLVVAWILSLLPLTPLEVTIGFVFGMRVGYVIVFVGKVIGCTAAFFLGRTLLHAWAQRQFGKNELLGAIDLAVRKEPYRICFVMRLAYIPISLKNFGLALVSVDTQVYMVSLFCVELFNSSVLVAIGSTAQDFGSLISGKEPKSPLQLAVMSLGCLCLVGLLVYLSMATRRALQEVRKAA